MSYKMNGKVRMTCCLHWMVVLLICIAFCSMLKFLLVLLI